MMERMKTQKKCLEMNICQDQILILNSYSFSMIINSPIENDFRIGKNHEKND